MEPMPITNQKQTKNQEEKEEEYSVAFSNGALKQLRDLKEYFRADDELTVIKLGISLLQKTKEGQISFI